LYYLFLKYPLKINPVSSKTQSKSLGLWRDLSRLCATTSSLIQRTFPCPIFEGKGRQRYYSQSSPPNFFQNFFSNSPDHLRSLILSQPCQITLSGNVLFFKSGCKDMELFQ